jgi:S1-C subfamily serine protease
MPAEEPGADDSLEPDDGTTGPPPDPLDRLWVHPTELSSFVATPASPPREARPREWAIGIASALTAVAVTVLVLVAFGALGGRHRAPVPPPVVTTPHDIVDYTVAARVAAAVAPSVVTVQTGDASQRPAGSGVVIRSNRVMTAAHVVAGATKVEVVTQGGDTIAAKVLGIDPQTDLALLEVSSDSLPLLSLAPSTELKVGQTVVAVAAVRLTRYWLGVNVVSDLNLTADTGTGVRVAGLVETGIASDATKAGGALVDVDGDLVGILTSPAAGPDGASSPVSGNGLAVPVNMLRDVDDQLEASGKVNHGWIGVVYEDGGPQAAGAVVAGVFPDSPAQSAGLQKGDVITRAGSHDVSGWGDAVAAARNLRPQDPLDLTYVRDGRPHSVRLALGTGDVQLLPLFPSMG